MNRELGEQLLERYGTLKTISLAALTAFLDESGKVLQPARRNLPYKRATSPCIRAYR